MFGVGEGPFGFEKLLRDAALLAIGENEADGGADKGSDDGEPGQGELVPGEGTPHDEDEKGNDDGKAVGDGKIAEARDGFGDGLLGTTRPEGSEENEGEPGEEEKKITPTGGAEGGLQSEEKIRVRERGEQEDEEKSEGE